MPQEKNLLWQNGVQILRNDPLGFDRLVKLPDVVLERLLYFVHYKDLRNTCKGTYVKNLFR